MNIFVSHSMRDKNLTDRLRGLIKKNGFTPLIAEDETSLSETITQKVERLIADSELAVVLLTRNGNSAGFVQQEVGYLQKSAKPMLLLVEKGLEKDVSGFLYGRDFLTVDPDDIDSGLRSTEERILSFEFLWRQKRAIGTIIFVILVAVLVWIAAKSSQ